MPKLRRTNRKNPLQKLSRMHLENQIIVSLRSPNMRFLNFVLLLEKFQQTKNFLRETKSLAFFAPWLKTSTMC